MVLDLIRNILIFWWVFYENGKFAVGFQGLLGMGMDEKAFIYRGFGKQEIKT